MDPEVETSGASQRLRQVLQELGTDDADIERATADGTLALLAVERLMVPESARFDLDDVVKRTGLDATFLVELWRSLGYPQPRPGEIVFTDTDVEILDRVGDMVAGDDQAAAVIVQISRVIGWSIARIASAQVDLVSGPQVSDDTAESQIPDDERFVQGLGDLLPVVPRVLEVVWRRHLRAAARRRMLVVAGDEETSAVVGFADLVGFTALSQEVSDAELARIVAEFESLSFGMITATGGRVVKMLGDEVMFTVPQPEAGAEIALSLVEATGEAAGLPEVRVGMAYGPVLEREGDLYGPVVNLASRATSIAHPGSVLLGPTLANRLAGDETYVVRRMRPRYLKAIGRTPLGVLRRSRLSV